VEKEGDALEAEVAPTESTEAATVELEVVVEKEGDTPEAPSGIKGERTVEVVVAEEVAVAPALVVAVLMQEMELTQEQILQEWVMQEHAR
jgi:hypothetical protein